jgi:glutathione S-transferase
LTLADILVIPTVDRLADLGLAGLWARRPGVTRWYAAVMRRASYGATFYRGARLSERLSIANLPSELRTRLQIC